MLRIKLWADRIQGDACKKKKILIEIPCRRKIVLWLIFIVLKGWMCVIKLKDWTNMLKLGKFENIVASYTFFF